jgi:hypothetical protein
MGLHSRLAGVLFFATEVDRLAPCADVSLDLEQVQFCAAK